jgi:hypothetical protein
MLFSCGSGKTDRVQETMLATRNGPQCQLFGEGCRDLAINLLLTVNPL